MTLDRARELSPKMFEKLKREIFSVRELIVVDSNYEEEGGEEVGELNPSDFNYFVYIPEASREVIGDDGLVKLISMIESSGKFDNFIASEDDLFGVKSDLDEDIISEVLLGFMEDIAS